MKKSLITLGIIALIAGSCFGQAGSKHAENGDPIFPLIGNTIGFIMYDFYNEDNTLSKIEILNEDGSNWYSFCTNIGDYYLNTEEHNENFEPWVFGPEIFGLAIRCIAQSETGYTIVVNEEKNIVKHLNKHEDLIFQTVEEHVVNRLISTDFSLNPIRKNPDDEAPTLHATADETELTSSVELKGDWIKIKDTYSNKLLGWIRWKKGDRFMIWLCYSV